MTVFSSAPFVFQLFSPGSFFGHPPPQATTPDPTQASPISPQSMCSSPDLMMSGVEVSRATQTVILVIISL